VQKSEVVSIEVLNDLTSQFVDVTSQLFELEYQVDCMRVVLLDLIEKVSPSRL
jgi:hypothetical protein